MFQRYIYTKSRSSLQKATRFMSSIFSLEMDRYRYIELPKSRLMLLYMKAMCVQFLKEITYQVHWVRFIMHLIIPACLHELVYMCKYNVNYTKYYVVSIASNTHKNELNVYWLCNGI